MKKSILSFLRIDFEYLIRSSFSSPWKSIVIPLPSREFSDHLCPIPTPIEGCSMEYMTRRGLLRNIDKKDLISCTFTSESFPVGNIKFFTIEGLSIGRSMNCYSAFVRKVIPYPHIMVSGEEVYRYP